MSKRRRKRQQTVITVEEFADVLCQTLQHYCIQAHVSVQGPFIGLTFATSESPTGPECMAMMDNLIGDMMRASGHGKLVEKLLQDEQERSPSGCNRGMKPSEN